MILEVAEIQIAPDQHAAFDEAIIRGVSTIIAKAQGYLGHRIVRGIESPERVLLQIEWATLENHTKDFRESSAFAQWREIVGPFFVQPPRVEHYIIVG
jgi:heme-degrading monooxygenase HmoA